MKTDKIPQNIKNSSYYNIALITVKFEFLKPFFVALLYINYFIVSLKFIFNIKVFKLELFDNFSNIGLYYSQIESIKRVLRKKLYFYHTCGQSISFN